MRIPFFLSLFLLIGFNCRAQQAGLTELGARPLAFLPVKALPSGSLRPPTHFRTGASQPWLRIGYFGKHLKKHLEPNSAALEHMKRYKTASWVNTGFTIGAAGTAIAGIAYALPYLGAVFGVHAEPGTRLTERPLFWFAATGVLATGGFIARRKATQQLQQAVSAHNNVLKANPAPLGCRFYLRPAAGEAGIGFGLGVAF